MNQSKKFFCVAALVCALLFTSTLPALAQAGGFKGKYLIGAENFGGNITVTDYGPATYKVQFENEAKPRIYSAEGSPTGKQTEYIESVAYGKVKTKFVFGNTASTGEFIHEDGKKDKVTRAK